MPKDPTAGQIPLNLTAEQVDDLLSEKQLLYAIFRAVSTVRNIIVFAFIVSVVLAIAGVAASMDA